MNWKAALTAVVLCFAGAGWAIGWPAAAHARAAPPLKNPAVLNIGFVCRWQPHCIRKQESAMAVALRHVQSYRPANWRVQLCNRNASRGGTRVDWVGFNNCIRNPNLRPPPKRKRRRSTA